MSQGKRHIETVLAAVQSGRAAARSALAASWWRSLEKHGLDPGRTEGVVLEGRELAERRARHDHFLHVAAPKLDQLYTLVGSSGCGVVLTDAAGVILDRRCGDGDRGVFDGWGLRNGADWSEAREGTNGIGTCIAEERQVTIHRDEHFLARNIGMSCLDAPIFGADGQLLGALDVSSARADQTAGVNRLIAATVAQTAQAIEAEYFRASFPGARIVVAAEGEGALSTLLAVDGDDLVVGATRAARRAFGLEPRGTLRPRPASDVIGGEAGPRGLERAERAALKRALARADGNVSAAARALGIGRATLYRRMKRLGLDG
ncbi:GAF domain-containing protein [Roseovarius nubinhibens]|uniref:Transcriptional regulatory protein n=1 Tax=Roseovarius nubinhibens (strain ATCC BAA-591 / DSM 15170 / ISM) TaxID=89187 RepID=A3SHC2_ROSNI|nr:GAF domain-containing protein [Roseovarius nubinhibens]EAP76753.1 transcriptional regulatory protein [Roseovarius nubinhibens ISM]